MFDRNPKAPKLMEHFSKLNNLFTFNSFSSIKFLSIECPPAKNSLITSKPNWIDKGKTPIELQTENRPPTKSQKPKTLSESIPNYPVFAKLVEHAHMCFLAIYSVFFFPNFSYSHMSHFLQLLAFNIVSAVVKVFELTKIKVSSTLIP